jgi:O-antigen/teichoic acid export membrane protein
MNQTFVKSTLILSIATLASKILGSIFRIPLQNIAGDEVLGIFTLVYPVYMVALILSVAGIPIAISKLISEARALNDQERIRKIYLTATILSLLFGLISFSLIFSFSHQIANVLGGPDTRLALIIVSTTLLIAPYMAVFRGYFQGFQDMNPTAVSQVLEQLVKMLFILIIAVILVNQNQSDQVVAGGVMIGSFLGAAVSTLYLRIIFSKSALKPKKTNARYSFQDFKQMSKTILYISLPICVGAITMALVNFVDSVTIPSSLKQAGETEKTAYLYGIYGRGLSLVQIATVFSSSVVLPLIPLITKTLAENNRDQAKGIIEKTHYLTHLISWPAAVGLFALTLPVNLALFKDVEGSHVLSVIGLSSLFTSLSILGTGILQGMNKAKEAAFVIVGAVIVKIVTNMVLVSSYGLEGAAYSTLAVYMMIFIANSYLIANSIPFSIWNKKITAMVVSSIIMGAIIGIPTILLNIEHWTRLTALVYTGAGIAIGGGIYFITLLLTNGITKQELGNLPVIKKFANKMKH